MKSVFFLPFVLCVCAHASHVAYDVAPTGTGTSFKVDNFHLRAQSQDNDLAQNGQVQASDVVPFNALEDRIQEMLNEFREVVVNGNDDLPPLDPLEIASAGPFEVDLFIGTSASMTVRNFLMDGLRWYVVDDVTFNAIRLTFGTHMTLPWLTITGSYDAEATFALWTVHRASGNFRIFINRLEVGVDMRLGTNLLGGYLMLRELDFKIDIQDVNVRVEGMVGSNLLNNAINNMVQSITQDFVQNHMDDLSQTLSEQLFDTINDVLSDYTLADLLS